MATRLARSLASGTAGALALTALHELVRRRVDYAPRMDVVAMRGLFRVLPGERHDPRRLHQLALAGDLLSNSLYYSIIAAPTRGETWMRAAILGTAAGLGALLLPERMGLGEPPHVEHRANRFMTIAWYMAGAAAAALAANLMAGEPSRAGDGDFGRERTRAGASETLTPAC